MNELDSGPGGSSDNADPNLPAVRKARGQSPVQAHYGAGSGYLDAQTAKQVDTGQKSGLHTKEPKRKRVTRSRRGSR